MAGTKERFKAMRSWRSRRASRSRDPTCEVPTGTSTITPEDHRSALNMYISKTEGGRIEVAEPLGPIEPAAQCA